MSPGCWNPYPSSNNICYSVHRISYLKNWHYRIVFFHFHSSNSLHCLFILHLLLNSLQTFMPSLLFHFYEGLYHIFLFLFLIFFSFFLFQFQVSFLPHTQLSLKCTFPNSTYSKNLLGYQKTSCNLSPVKIYWPSSRSEEEALEA